MAAGSPEETPLLKMMNRVIICCGNKNVSVRVRTRAAQEQTNTMNQRLDLLSDASTLSRPGSLVGIHFELILCTKLTFSLVSDWLTRPIRSYIPRAFQVVEHQYWNAAPATSSKELACSRFRCQPHGFLRSTTNFPPCWAAPQCPPPPRPVLPCSPTSHPALPHPTQHTPLAPS